MDKILNDVVAEYERAVKKFPQFNSGHEGYAVLKEEVDELWDCIKCNVDPKLTRAEAVQVAAMTIRFINDVCDKERERHGQVE